MRRIPKMRDKSIRKNENIVSFNNKAHFLTLVFVLCCYYSGGALYLTLYRSTESM